MTSQKKPGEGAVAELMPQDIEYQAAHWITVLDGDAPSPEQVAAFHAWKLEHPSHRKAFEELLALWGSANILTRLEPPASVGRQAGRPSASAWPLRFSAAAAVMLLVIVGLFQPWENAGQRTYITAVGEQKNFVLPDQSEILLNTNSIVVVDYQSARRVLRLEQGEAHFEVAHDPARPFDVYAGGGRVKAIGTAFTVRMAQQGVSVLVTEGVVEVFAEPEQSTAKGPPAITGSADPAATPAALVQAAAVGNDKGRSGVRVSSGRQVEFTAGPQAAVTVTQVDNVSEKISWQRGKLVFKGEPLEKVIEEFSRYTSLKIIVPSKKMRALKVGGIFKVGDTTAMLDALENGFGIQANYVTDDIVYLEFSE